MGGLNKIKLYFERKKCPSIYQCTDYEIKKTVYYLLNQNLPFENKSILVLGCGNGMIEEELLKHCRVKTITLLDFSTKLLNEAKGRIPWANSLNCDLRTELNLIKGSYDCIYSVSTIQYFTPKEVARINTYLFEHLTIGGVLAHFNIPDKQRRFLYRINNVIALGNIKYLYKKYDFIDEFSRWCHRKEFLYEGVKTVFLTPSMDWERFDVKLEK